MSIFLDVTYILGKSKHMNVAETN